MSLVTVAEARAQNLGGGLTDAALQAKIDAVEAYLARRIGPLTDDRTETFYPRRGAEPLFLRRPTDEVEVTDNGTLLVLGEDSGHYRLLYSGTVVELVDTDWTFGVYGVGTVTVEYEPNDLVEVREAIIDLLRVGLAEGPYVSERIGEYSYSKAQAPGSLEATRRAIVNRLLPRRPFRTERIISSVRA